MRLAPKLPLVAAIGAVIFAVLGAGSLQAQVTKSDVCGNMALVASAIQKARLDKVKERDVTEVILASNPPWPERYNAAIVHMTPWVYQQKRRDLRNKDLGAAWNEVCQDNWEQLAEIFE